jgi:hypothetical protein
MWDLWGGLESPKPNENPKSVEGDRDETTIIKQYEPI